MSLALCALVSLDDAIFFFLVYLLLSKRAANVARATFCLTRRGFFHLRDATCWENAERAESAFFLRGRGNGIPLVGIEAGGGFFRA